MLATWMVTSRAPDHARSSNDFDVAIRSAPEITPELERSLQLAAHIVPDVGNLISASAFRPLAEIYEDIFKDLIAEGAAPTDLRNGLPGLGGLCNIMLHDYVYNRPQDRGRGTRECPGAMRAISA